MKSLIEKYGPYLKDKKFLFNTIFSIAILIGSGYVSYRAAIFADIRESNSVTDLILSNTRVYDVDGIFVYGPIFVLVFATTFCFLHPQRIPFTAKALTLLIMIRSAFVTLTHLAPFPTRAVIEHSNIISSITSGGELFFSGHTAIPFLLALIFWKNIFLRIVFLITSILFGTAVLLGHLHYTIDVMAAFFITYFIFHMAVYFFRNDWEIFKHGLK